MAKRKHIQPFTQKPVTEEDALEKVCLAQEKYDDAVRERGKYLHSGKPGTQRRENQIKWAKRGLEDAKSDLEKLQNQRLTLSI